MPLDLEEDFVFDVPVKSILLIKVTTDSPMVNATGRLDAPDDSKQNAGHDEIVGKTRELPLSAKGIYIARVNLVLNDDKKDQSATVQFSIKNGDKEIRAFAPSFKGKSEGQDKFLGLAKWTITVV